MNQYYTLYALLWLLNVVLIIDWAKNRRQLFWLGALICFGPLGAMAYTIYFYEQINFPIELAKTVRKLTGKQVLRMCPRCGLVDELELHQDGRLHHFMCRTCIRKTYLDPVDPLDVIEAAQTIIKSTEDS